MVELLNVLLLGMRLGNIKYKISVVIIIIVVVYLVVSYADFFYREDTNVTQTTEAKQNETSVETVLETELPETIFGTQETSATETEPVETTEVIEPTVEPTVEIENNDENLSLVSLGKFTLTAYCSCPKCCGQYAYNRPVDEYGNEIVYGSIGVRLVAGISIAVDPRVIPYGSDVVINGHTYTAHDTGGAINGHRIDVYFDNHQDALNFGVQYAEVFLAAN